MLKLLEAAIRHAPTLLGWTARFTKKQVCLLVVENHPISAKLIREMIEFEGFTCDVVDTVVSAQTMLKLKRYAVMFLDMRLPGVQGWSYLNEMSAEFPATHVVVVCGAPEDVGKVNHGVYFGVILKPISNRSIRDVLRKSRL